MPKKKSTLTKNEWALMSVLWESSKPLVVSEIIEQLEDKVEWSYSTYLTQLGRLVDSGYLKFEKRGRIRFFYPAVEMSTCIQEENKNITDRMTPEASNKLLLCMLRDAKGMTQDEASELEKLVDELRERSNG